MAKSIPTPNNDRLIGTASNDTIDGLAGNDTITGLSGNDSLTGGVGDDSLDGGVGKDKLLGDAGNDTLIGAAGNDVLDGGADNDRLDGGAGADTLIGGTGIDTMMGGDQADFYIVDSSLDVITEKSGSKAGLDSVQSSVNYTLPANVENLTLTGLTDLKGTGSSDRNVIVGNDGSNLLDGKNGNDTLQGKDGDDTLLGGGGVDQLIGGAGSDTYQISSNEDKIIETATDDGDDVVESSVSYTLGANLETLTLTGTDAINGTGNELANIIEGNPGDNRLQGEEGDDTLQGGAGNDTFKGGAGDDVIEGGDGTDQVVYLGQEDDYKITYDADSDGWIVEDANGTDGDGTDEGRDELSGIESLVFANKGVVDLTEGLTLSINNVNQLEGTGTDTRLEFTVSLSAASLKPVRVTYNVLAGTATAGTDFTPLSGVLEFGPNEQEKTVSVTVKGDTTVETDETFSVQLSNPVGADLAQASGTGTIENDDQATISIAGVSLPEGNGQAVLALSLSAPSSQPVTVSYTTANGTAQAGRDYTAQTGSVTFPADTTTQTVSIPVTADSEVEPDETFTVRLSKPQQAKLDPAAGSATVTIQNDDQAILSIAGGQINEGNAGSLNLDLLVTLSAPSSQPVTVDYIAVNGTAASGSDFILQPGTLTFPAGKTSQKISIAINGDSDVENDETFNVMLGNAQNASISSAAGSATVVISNDDLPTVSIADVSITEGNSGTQDAVLTVSLSAASTKEVSIDYATADFNAVAGSDYTAQRSTLVFPVGTTTQPIRIPITGDTQVEADEQFSVSLSNPRNATLSTSKSAKVTLTNDDIPTLSLNSTRVTEGNTGTTPVEIIATLDSPSNQVVTANYGLRAGTAQPGDYLPASGTLTFNPGVTRQTIALVVNNDTDVETDETFSVTLSDIKNAKMSTAADQGIITLVNDDLPNPELSVSPASITEGGTAQITVSLSRAATVPVSVNYATADATAQASSDYTAASGSLSFNPGETSKTIAIATTPDSLDEVDETFSVSLSNAQGVAIRSSGTQASVTLNDDDAPPVVSITSAVRVGEGAAGTTTQASLAVTLSAASSQTVTVAYSTTDGTAIAGSDYTAQTNTLSFAPGETSKTVTIDVLGDSLVEKDETFTVNLASPQNATLSTTAAKSTVSIVAMPTLSFGTGGSDAEVVEGDSGTQTLQLTATLSSAFSQDVRVDYTTQDGTAEVGSDYTAQSGSLIFAPGTTTQTLSIPVMGDTVQENTETFRLVFSNPQNLNVNGPSTLYITNDDLDGVTFDGFDGVWTDDNESIPGSKSNDRLIGMGGNDTLTGEEGRDLLIGGAGDDNLDGGYGQDWLEGGLGADILYGGSDGGADWIDGGAGNDVLNAEKYGDGWDSLYVYGNDTLLGGAGDDRIYHYGSNSYKLLIEGGDGNDTLYGAYSGDDTLRGGKGDDVIGIAENGNAGAEGGNDLIEGGAGRDTLYGGSGNDTFVFKTGDSGVGTGNRDRIEDFSVDATSEVLDLREVSPSGSALTFQKMAAFTAANQVRYTLDTPNKLTIVQINLDANTATSEMEIELVGLLPLNASEFLLTAG